MADQRPRPPPTRGRTLRALGQTAEADQPGVPRHQMARASPHHRHRGPLGTSPTAAARFHRQPRRSGRRATRAPLRADARRDQPPHPRAHPDHQARGAPTPRPRAHRAARATRRLGHRPCRPTLRARHTRRPRNLALAVPRRPSRSTDQRLPARRTHAPTRTAPSTNRTTALFDLATELPAAVLARLLGIHIKVAVEWQQACASDWASYAADYNRRTPTPAQDGRTSTTARG